VRRNLIQKGLSFRPELSDGQRRPPLRLFEQNLDVLNRRDEAILNLLAPQPPPAQWGLVFTFHIRRIFVS
jgi:hypothetical protein